jgi:hypothetical protein
VLELGSEEDYWFYVFKFRASKSEPPWSLPFWLLTNLLFGFRMNEGSCDNPPRPRKERNSCRNCMMETID